MKNRCVIIGGGDCSVKLLNSVINEDDFIICADSGYDVIRLTKYKPNLIIGDFDSVKSSILDVENIIRLPIEKDITDCEAAIIEAIKYGYSRIVLLGGTGGRFEHTFANVSLLAKYTKTGNNIEMIDDKHRFMCVYNSQIEIPYRNNQQISVFAFGNKAYGVTEKGFHYTLNNYDLDPSEPLGISNDIVGNSGIISVKNGVLIIIDTKM